MTHGSWPDAYTDANKFHDKDLQRAMQRGQRAETKMLTRVRLIVRRVLGRHDSPVSPYGPDGRPLA